MKKPNIFEGKTVVLVGEFQSMTKAELKQALIKLGATVVGGLKTNTNYFIYAGDGGKKYNKARSFGVQTLSEPELLQVMPEIPREPAEEVPGLLRKLKRKLGKISPTWLEEPSHRLKLPTDEEIAEAEKTLGFEFDPALRTFFASCDFALVTDGNYSYEGFGQMVGNWQVMTDLLNDGTFDHTWDERVEDSRGVLQQVYWNPAWMPFVVDGGGNMVCVDHDPGPKGAIGQLLFMESQDGQGPCPADLADVALYLAEQLRLLQAGKYTVDEEGFVEIDSYG